MWDDLARLWKNIQYYGILDWKQNEKKRQTLTDAKEKEIIK